MCTAPGIGVSEVAERLYIHQSTCSQLVEKLVISGLITKNRSKVDQRRVGLTISSAGTRKLKKAPGPLEGVFPAILTMLDEDQLQELNHALGNVVNKLRTGNEEYSNAPLADL